MATSESFEVAKVFRRSSDGPDQNPDYFQVERVLVPFCQSCRERHESEVRKFSPGERFWMACRGREALGVPGYGVLGLLFLFVCTRRPEPILLGVVAVFALLVWYSYRTAYRTSEHLAIPPATSVTSAFDFTDIKGRHSNREHRTLFLRNDLFADALAGRNLPRLWTEEDEVKRQKDWRRFFR
jgi:hypothetical protein